jgi:hypothetical protein
MSLLKFSDGMEFDLAGPLRIEERSDGFYLVGEGTLCAIKDEEEGRKFIQRRRTWLAKVSIPKTVLVG